MHAPTFEPKLGEKLCALERAVNEEGGCAIRITTTDGNILIDTGLPGSMSPSQNDRLILISHEHSDHTGNLREAIDLCRSQCQLVPHKP
jgi:glyoxylase-like metal-dependent hydrolase (beta-lactamase superfamily II)